MAHTTKSTKPKPSARRRIVRLVAWLLGAVVLVVVAALTILTLPATRARLLDDVLARADASLPGTLVVAEASWPSLGAIVLQDVSWSDGDTLLARAGRVSVSARLRPLLRRDVDITRLECTGIYANVPAIAARLAGDDTAATAAPRGEPRFPRGGAIPGLPSIAVRRLVLSADSLRASPRDVITNVDVAAAASLLSGHPPAIQIERLRAEGGLRRWGIDTLSLDVDLARGAVAGRAAGRVADGWPVVVRISSERFDHIVVTAAERDEHAPPRDPGVRAEVDLVRDGLEIRRVEVAAQLHVPGTRDLAGRAGGGRLDTAPALEPVRASVAAAVSFDPVLSLDASMEIEQNEWIRSGRIAVTHRDGITAVPVVDLRLDGASLGATGYLRPDSLALDARVEVDGDGWLRRLRPESAPPSPLTADVTATVRGEGDHGRLEVGVEARAVVGEVVLESLRATAHIATDASTPTDVALRANVNGYHAGTALEISRRDAGVVARVAPIVVRTQPASSMPKPPGAGAGTVRLAGQALDVSGLALRGAFGNSIANLSLDGERRGSFDVRCEWPQAPAALIAALAGEGEPADSLRAHWQSDGPFRLRATGTVDLGERPGADAAIAAELPGPRTLAPLLDAGARVADLGAIAVDGRARVATTAEGVAVDARLDLGATAWIDTAIAQVHWRRGGLAIDTLAVAVDSIRVAAGGALDRERLDLTAGFTVPHSRFIQRFAPGLPDVSLRGRARVQGTPRSPRGRASVAGRLAGIAVAARVRADTDGLALQASAPDGVTTPHFRLDTLELTAVTEQPLPRALPARISLRARGPDFSLQHGAVIDTTGAITVAVDTLEVVVAGEDIAAQRPFVVTIDLDSTAVAIDSLDMAGSLGRITAAGVVREGRADFRAAIAVVVPRKPSSITVAENLWPETVDADFVATPTGDNRANVTVAGITLDDGRRPSVSATLVSARDSVGAQLFVSDRGDTLVRARGSMPGVVSLFPATFRPTAGDVAVDIRAAGLPVAVGHKRRVARLEGRAVLSGAAAHPEVVVEGAATFPGWPRLDAYRLAVRSTAGADTSQGITGDLQFARDAQPLISAQLSYPVRLSLSPPGVLPLAAGEMSAVIDSKELSLDEFEALLPPDVGLDGFVTVHVKAAGARDNPDISGRLATPGATVSVAERLRLLTSGEITLAGSLRDPVARGELVIENGLIRIPDPPKELHPTTGTALLLDAADTTAVAVSPGAAAAAPAPPSGDVDVVVKIPSGLWIRGQGLDAELAGELRIRQRADRPTLTGELRAVRGTLILLGRSFQLERGSVVFYGDDEANPALNVELTTTVDGVVARVTLTGTALEPELLLSSNPEMPEGDIMSYLVFGRPLDDLDQDQVGLVETRATEIAAAMGAVRLQEGLSKQLGVDMVTIRSGRSSDEASAIVVGKYLNPRLLVKYERLLEEQAAQFINIEYFLTRRLKIETLYGRQDQQGVEIEWSNEY